jgi:hypothetical protein
VALRAANGKIAVSIQDTEVLDADGSFGGGIEKDCRSGRCRAMKKKAPIL